MITKQKIHSINVEIIIVDSGSTDNTIAIGLSHSAKITHIEKENFSFGRSLNIGCEVSRGNILVFISGHCVPQNYYWLENLCDPILRKRVSYTYGRQIGDDHSNYSERCVFAKYFPPQSAVPQHGFFANNANAAIDRQAWERFRFDEELTGLEDLHIAKRLLQNGDRVGYISDAIVFHHHNETWRQIRRRYEREAYALQYIMPEIKLSGLDVLRYIFISTVTDWLTAWKNGVTSTSRIDMFRYRYNQYLGSYKGNRRQRVLSQEAKEHFFYPSPQKEYHNEKWLGSLCRPTTNKGKQPES